MKHDYNITVKLRGCKRSNVSRCVIASSVDTYIIICHVRWLIKLSHHRLPSALSREGPSGQLSVKCDTTVSCIKDGCKTNAHFVFHCVRYSWESQQSRQFSRIWIRPYFKVIPGRVRVMPGSAIPGRNWVVTGHPSHLYCFPITDLQ